MNVDRARLHMKELTEAIHFTEEMQHNHFSLAVEDVVRLIGGGTPSGTLIFLPPEFLLVSALKAALNAMRVADREHVCFLLNARVENWAAGNDGFKNLEFRQYFRQSREQDAASRMTMHWPAFQEAVKHLPMDAYPADVMAYVIWATLGYVYDLTDDWNVDALKEEYPWVSVLTRDTR